MSTIENEWDMVKRFQAWVDSGWIRTRKEPIGGQAETYVKLDDVMAFLEKAFTSESFKAPRGLVIDNDGQVIGAKG